MTDGGLSKEQAASLQTWHATEERAEMYASAAEDARAEGHDDLAAWLDALAVAARRAIRSADEVGRTR